MAHKLSHCRSNSRTRLLRVSDDTRSWATATDSILSLGLAVLAFLYLHAMIAIIGASVAIAGVAAPFLALAETATEIIKAEDATIKAFLYNLRGHDSLHRLRTWLLKIPNAPSLDAARVAYAELNAAVDLIAAEDEFQNLCPLFMLEGHEFARADSEADLERGAGPRAAKRLPRGISRATGNAPTTPHAAGSTA